MKARTTKKELRTLPNLYGFWYCSIWYLLSPFDPIYYTAWIYGRCEDVYKIGDYYISTWYSSTWKSIDYKIVEKYNNKAKELDLPFEQRKRKCEKLIEKMIKEGSSK